MIRTPLFRLPFAPRSRLSLLPRLAVPRWGLGVVLGLALSACGPKGDAKPGEAAAGASAPAAASAEGGGAASGAAAASAAAAAASAPPVSVTLVKAQARDFTVTLEASGSVSALSAIDIKPQVSAQVLQVHVKEGQFVQKGQPLFTLDARADEVALKKAEAQLLKDQATLADAKRLLARNQELVARNFISQGALDTAQANVDAQQAVVASDRAAIDAVRVQLSYSRIAAPSAGRVGQIAVFPGSTVTPTGAALLTLTQIDPVAVTFSLPQRNLPDALAALKAKEGAAGKVTAVLPDGAGTRTGKLSFVDSAVDATSGTVKAKAVFGNSDQALWPGAFVTVKMATQTLEGAIVVPQASIVNGTRGTLVFVAGEGNKAQLRPIKLLSSQGTEAVVSGLKPGERVVLDGRQNVRPGVQLIERPADAGGGGGKGGRGASAPAEGGASGVHKARAS